MKAVCRRLERQQERLLAALEAWPREWIGFKPSAEAWSAVEVLSHLVKVERGTARDLEEGLKMPGPPVTLDQRKRAQWLIRWLLSDKRTDVPRSVAGSIWPDAAPDFEDAMEQWRASRELVVAAAPEGVESDGCVFVHPSGGAMDGLLLLRFLHAHTRHHEHQLERLRVAAESLRA